MSISGVVVHARPERANEIRMRLEAMNGVEVHSVTDDGRLVVTVDVEDDHEAADTLMQMQREEGILSASLIYNYFDTQSGPVPAE